MKNTLLILTATLLITLGACKSKAKTAASSVPSATDQPTVYKGVTDEACAVEVSFGSPGSGIDLKAYEAVKSKMDVKKLKYTEKGIGREGETRICLPLTEIKGKEKNEFIEQLKKIAADAQLVSVSIR